MTSTPPSKALVTDASFVIALCAKEAGRYAVAQAALGNYARDGWSFYVPGVLIGEVLYALCRKQADGHLTTEDHAVAVESLKRYLEETLPAPNRDAALIDSAERVRSGYSCRHTADSLYLALALDLARSATVELLTFDEGQKTQAHANAPSIRVKLLV